MRREEKIRVRDTERERERVCELIECVEEGIALSGFDVPDYDGHLLSRGGVSAQSLSLSSEWQKDWGSRRKKLQVC